MPSIDYTNLYASQNTLSREYTTYTEAYLKYLSCENNKLDNPPSSCRDTEPSNTTLLSAISNVSNNIAALKASPNNNGSLPPYAEIDASYNKVVNMRNQLDLKLQQLYNLQNSAPNTYQTQLDSTVYSGILWTVLATTLVYYVFTKL